MVKRRGPVCTPTMLPPTGRAISAFLLSLEGFPVFLDKYRQFIALVLVETRMTDGGLNTLPPALAAGDERAYATLYDILGERLFRAAAAITGSREEARDLVQELFVAMVRSRHKLARVENIAAYMFTSLRRLSIRTSNRSRRDAATLAERARRGAATSGQRNSESGDERIERALASLGAPQREVIALKIDGGLTFAEIASVLGVSANTAASRYRYALENLRAMLR